MYIIHIPSKQYYNCILLVMVFYFLQYLYEGTVSSIWFSQESLRPVLLIFMCKMYVHVNDKFADICKYLIVKTFLKKRLLIVTYNMCL